MGLRLFKFQIYAQLESVEYSKGCEVMQEDLLFMGLLLYLCYNFVYFVLVGATIEYHISDIKNEGLKVKYLIISLLLLPATIMLVPFTIIYYILISFTGSKTSKKIRAFWNYRIGYKRSKRGKVDEAHKHSR